MKRQILTMCVLTLMAHHALAEHHASTDAEDHRSAAWQIEAFSTAAPAFIGNSATILGTDGSILREGSNGWTCQSANPRPVPEAGWGSAHEAMAACHDGEGMNWMMGYMAGEWIESGPHLMLMPKDPATLAHFPTDFTTGAPYVMFAGTDYAHLMIPVTGYYQYQPESAPK